MANPLLADFEAHGWQIVRNPHGRKMTEAEVSELLSESRAEAIVAGVEPLTAAVFDANPQLRVVSRCGSGFDSVDVAAARERHVVLMRTPEAPAEAVAELTIGLAIGLLRRIAEADRNLRDGVWHALMGRALGRSRIGIAGLGHVGSRVARVATVLGAEVGYCDQAVDAPEFQRFDNVHKLAEWTDVLTIHLPHGADTHNVVNADVLDALGPEGVLINTARGGLVDEEALYQALRSGRLAGAALDVFEDEPYQGPLRELPNVILTSHMGSYARQTRGVMETEALRNVLSQIELD
jgi:D-3-phosphoglycerate dehydrogenase